MNPRRDAFVAEVTAGLKGDPELRRDVSAELGSHLDAAIDESRAKGRTEDESLDDALKAMGSPVTLAGDLVDANRRRMRLRGLLKIAVAGLVVPAAVLLAAWMVVRTGEKMALFSATLQPSIGDRPLGLLAKFAMSYERAEQRLANRWSLSPRDRIVVFGDRSRPTRAEQQRALCDLDPSNRVFYANYIRSRIEDRYRPAETGYGTNDLMRELRAGEQLDPDNAWYNYIAAGTMMEQAGEWKWTGKGTNQTLSLLIKDTNLMEQAFSEFQRGIDKPFCKTYAGDLMAMRRSLMPPSRTLDEETLKIALAAGVLLPHISIYRNLARVSKEYAATLISQGRTNEAVVVLGRIMPLAEDVTRDSWCLIEVLVAGAVVGIAEKQAAPMLEQAGLRREADVMRLKAEAMTASFKVWRESGKGRDDSKLRTKAGVMAGMLLPALGDQGITDADLAPGRNSDFVMLEQSAVASLIVVFVFMMLLAGLLALRWRRADTGGSAPFLMLPDWRSGAWIIAMSVVLPVAIFILYTRFSGLAGRENAVTSNVPRYVAELLALGLFILVASARMSLRHVRSRCRVLGVPVPEKHRALAWLAVWRSDYGLYLGTAARSLIPAFAVAVLLLGGVVQPWLAREETRWLRADPLLDQGANIGGFTSVETRVVNKLKAGMLEGARKGEP